MTTVNVELFEALKKIDGVSEEQAKRAAEGDLSEIKSDIKFLKWGLAAIAGGGSAGALHVARSFLKSVLNASTAGVSTPVVSLVEDAAAIVIPIMVILAPVLVLFLFLCVVGVTALALKKWMGTRRQIRRI